MHGKISYIEMLVEIVVWEVNLKILYKKKKKKQKKKIKEKVDINHSEFKNIIIWNSSLCCTQEFCSSRRLEFKFLSLVVAI